MQRFAFALVFALAIPALAEDKPAEITVRTGHFEKNNSGLKGDTSFLILRDLEAFEKVFGTVPPLGNKKNNPVTKADFEKNAVVAVITRAAAITTYREVTGATQDGKLTLKYKSVTGPAGTANFASPLIVLIPKDGLKEAVFIANGTEAGTAK